MINAIVKSSAPIIRSPEVPDISKPYIVRVSFSSPEEDLHNTRMGDSTLKNFLKQSNDGVMVCPNHIKECPIGITSNSDQNDAGVVYCDMEFDRDLPLSHPEAGFPNTENIIRQVNNGRITKTSVGGYGGELICNIDSKDMLTDWACWHWPGVTYKVKVEDPEDSKKLIEKEIRSVPSWENLQLGEISSVWAGSNLQSEIMKTRAMSMLDEGMLDRSTTLRLNNLFGYVLDVSRAKPDKTIIDMGKNIGDNDMTPEEIKALNDKVAAAEAAKTAAEAAKLLAETERDALKGDSAELQAECERVRKDNVEDYKTLRGANLTGEDLTNYEEKQKLLTLSSLKSERYVLDVALGKEPVELDENGKVKAGSQSSSTDNSKNEEEQAQLPPWMRKAEEKKSA